MTKTITLFTKFISSFIEKNCSEDIVELWNDETKDEFVKMIEKELKKTTTKDKKKKKSADAPKGARSAYILFCMKERPKINKEFPELSNQDKVKLMAERWNKAKDDEDVMEHFKNLAEEDKKRAVKDKENYVPSDEGDEKPKKKTKRSKTGYMLFCENERTKVKKEGYTGKDITTELAKRWKDLKDEDEDMYAEYMEKAAELKKSKVEESDSSESEEEENKPKKREVKKKAVPKKAVAPKKKTTKKKVVEESDSSEEEIDDE